MVRARTAPFEFGFVLALACALSSTATVRANGIVRDSLAAISSGRGGTNVAHEDNLSIIHDNPAGIAWLEDALRLELGTDFLLRDVRYRDPLDSARSRDGVFVLPQLAVAGRLPGTPISLGLGVFLPGGYGVEYEMLHAIYGEQDYESEGSLLKVLPTVAFKIGEYISVGGGVGLGYSDAHFKLPYTFQTGSLAGVTAMVEADTDAVGVTGNVGIQYRPTDQLTFGVAYVTETWTEQEGDFDVDVTGSGLPVTDSTASYDLEYTFRWPRSLTGGASYLFSSGRASAEVAWYGWRSAFDEFRLALKNGDNPEFDGLAGTRPKDRFPLDWRDSVAVRIGYEHFLETDTTIRVGYIYNLNPIPDGTLTPILPGILDHSFAFGIGQRFGRARLDFAYQYTFATTQKVNTSDIQGGDFDNSELRAQAHWFFLNFSLVY